MPPRRFQARNSLEKMIRRTREKVFGPGRAVPLDRNAKARIMAYARAWGARHAQPRQHRGPIIRAFLEVLEALLWGFHNSRDGRCFPSYEAIAAKAQCARSTVAESLKVLEWARVLTWQHRIARIQVRERDLFGRWASRWRVIRTSNAYVFRDPLARPAGVPASQSENRIGTQNQEVIPSSLPMLDPDSGLARAPRRGHQRKIAHEQEPRDGRRHLTPGLLRREPWAALARESARMLPDVTPSWRERGESTMDTTPTKQRVTIGALPALWGTFHQDVKGAVLPRNAPFLFRLAAVIRRGGSAGEARKKAREALLQAAINVGVYVTLSGILCAIFLMRHVHRWRKFSASSPPNNVGIIQPLRRRT